MSVPGTATEPIPQWNVWTAAGKRTSTASNRGLGRSTARPRPGVSTKKSNTTSSPLAVRANRNPPPARLVSPGSATAAANPAATTASNALPPARSAPAAASATAG